MRTRSSVVNGVGRSKVVVEAVVDGGPIASLTSDETLHRPAPSRAGGVPERGERRRIAVEVAGQREMSLFLRRRHTSFGEVVGRLRFRIADLLCVRDGALPLSYEPNPE